MPAVLPPSEGQSPGEVRAAVRALFPRVEGGQGCAVTIRGSAGTGRSRLLADLAHDARDRIWTVLTATAEPSSVEVPRGIVLDALRPILGPERGTGGAPAEGPGETPPPGLPLSLMSLLPPESPRRPTAVPPVAEEATAWEIPTSLSPAEGNALLLRRLWDQARRSPVLLVVDDAQWIDELSQGLLSTAARELGKRRLLVALAFDPEAAPALDRRFADGEHGGLADVVYTLTRSTTSRPRPLPQAPPPSPEAQEPSLLESLLGLGAAAGLEFDARVLVEATHAELSRVLEALEEGCRRGWLWHSGEESFHFSGERTWKWAQGLPYQSLPARHRRIAESLLSLHPHPSGRVVFALADHWLAAGETGEALPYLVRGAEIAFGAGAYEAAREGLLRALGALSALPVSQRGAEEVRVLVDLAEVLDAKGESTQAASRLREALTRAEQLHLPARESVRIEILLADLQRRWGRGEAALGILERARARASEARDPAAEATVLSRIAMVQRRQGRWADARRNIDRGLELLREGQPSAHQRALVHFSAADIYVWGGPEDDEAARQHVQETRRALAEIGQGGREAALTNLEGLHASQRGDFPEALRLWGRAAETALRMGNLVDAANMFGNLAEVHAEAGRHAEAATCMAQALELVQGLEEPRIRGQVHLAAATLAWVEHDLPRAEAEIRAGVELLSDDVGTDLRQQLEFLRARIRLSEGRVAEAREIVRHLDPLRYPELLPPNQRREYERMVGKEAPSPASPSIPSTPPPGG